MLSALTLIRLCLQTALASPESLYLNFHLALILQSVYVPIPRYDSVSFPHFFFLENANFPSCFAFFNTLYQQLHFKVEITLGLNFFLYFVTEAVQYPYDR